MTYNGVSVMNMLNLHTTGVYLSLKGEFIEADSTVRITDIGTSADIPNGALQCITDWIPCCRSQNPRRGEWYLPSGVLVRESRSDSEFYRNRGDNGEVYLNRPSVVISPTGRFCCEVADATSTNQTVCVNIGEFIN